MSNTQFVYTVKTETALFKRCTRFKSCNLHLPPKLHNRPPSSVYTAYMTVHHVCSRLERWKWNHLSSWAGSFGVRATSFFSVVVVCVVRKMICRGGKEIEQIFEFWLSCVQGWIQSWIKRAHFLFFLLSSIFFFFLSSPSSSSLY